MPDTLRIIIYIIVVVGASATLIKEFKKPQKNIFLISFNFLIFIGFTYLLTKKLM
ncbi:hypothetical protein ICM_01389 [Bacillus cereus BAG1X2-3]|uniref:Amino acid transporter n=1 Tax=Bacillus thuringiensis TaxID=1428 RepID=A0ABD6RW42_BACTU|nr:hypothetical protein ICC_03429 [Bacillus cereus BAG1X1-1]EOO49434.1 hypothetical protein ICI_01952 [Bacillus cereus BAG1X2-1]EOO51560.1 hypothetical protein ICK_03400 [Bacillus cereus BAG1X2-2]EOO60469.1 hypothetical protein ICM_01389 [Bacillus cereus BAG1X2-3]EOP06730.1 hypothetical protein ICO_01951 [Bacillus cereus BAG2O-1]KXH90471.1 amino acid transporter [Bacillus sp. JH7]PEQ62129.1 hypothetical protein CN474_30245 [Bacillus thuringiensis]PFN23944.1 hypothetical protein COJ69_08760 [